MSVITPNSEQTWRYISNNIKIKLKREGKTIIIGFDDKEIRLPPYPKIRSVKLIEVNGRHVPIDIPKDWIAQWKANGSNIRFFSLNGILLAFLRGGYLLDWKQYYALLSYSKLKNLIELSSNYIVFGELVGPKSLVGECKEHWKEFLGEDIGVLIFEIYDLRNNVFLPINEAESLSRKYGLDYIKTVYKIDISELYNMMENFLKICEGKMWEGFVFKDKMRGSIKDVKEKTFKWRLDQTPEFMFKVIPKRKKEAKRDARLLQYKEAFRKFLFEGYLDPPHTREEVSKEAYMLRNKILELINLGQKEPKKELKIKISREISESIRELCQIIFPDEIREEEIFKQLIKQLVKAINRIVWAT